MSVAPRRAAERAGVIIRRLGRGIVHLFRLQSGDTSAERAGPAPAPPSEPLRGVPMPPAPPKGPPSAPPAVPLKTTSTAIDGSPLEAARRRERERCAAIVTSPAGLKHPGLACSLAFHSRLSRSEALALLEHAETTSVAFDHLGGANRRFLNAMASWHGSTYQH
jgi:hypothetical protein